MGGKRHKGREGRGSAGGEHAAIGRMVVVGVGLIGASFATALKVKGAVGEVVGVGRGRANLELAVRHGIIDRVAELPEALTQADVVFLAVPMGVMPAVFQSLAQAGLPPGCIVTDAGSVKGPVLDAARVHLGADVARFVPGHPVAGSERHGAGAADRRLYKGRSVILTPGPETDPGALERISRLWETCGARVRLMDAEDHDQLFAAVSHAPHLIAYAAVSALARRAGSDRYLEAAGTGFRDFSRIAAAPAEVWRDIALSNRLAILAELGAFRAELDYLITLLEEEQGMELASCLNLAAEWRRRLQ